MTFQNTTINYNYIKNTTGKKINPITEYFIIKAKISINKIYFQ